MTIGVTGATSDPLIIYLTNMFSFEPYFRIICIIVRLYTTAMFPFLIFDTNFMSWFYKLFHSVYLLRGSPIPKSLLCIEQCASRNIMPQFSLALRKYAMLINKK